MNIWSKQVLRMYVEQAAVDEKYIIDDNLQINELMSDSIKNKNILDGFFSALSTRYIKNFFQIRIRSKYSNTYQFQCNYTPDQLTEVINSSTWKKIFSSINRKYYLDIYKIKHNAYSLGSNDYIFSLKREYPSFYDIFSFQICHSYNQLSHQKQFLLLEQLNSIISLITISTSLKNSIKSNINFFSSIQPNQFLEKKLIEQHNLSLNEYRYLQAISLGGSSKQIAHVIQKSPRTIEKQIVNLCKKLKISSKLNLQIYARAFINSINTTIINNQQNKDCYET
jgi:DNA-binding CsgD family transcriptional regulator